MVKYPKTKKEAFKELLSQFSDVLSNNGCNDFAVANTPEMYLALEEEGAANLRMSLESFRKSPDYEDYKPSVSEDGKTIYTQDFTILHLIELELGLK